ncbi:flavin reductase [Flavobacterium sp. W21_SRS_FM6]|uniref:flavin reductase n=1 Tax=Flavobacterium sp. W21_SRS_FM6 TaxID=3240268 RepID=UPI003F9383A9
MSDKSSVEHTSTHHSVTPEAFRNGMAGLPGTVNIVTTDGDEGKAGFTATAVCSVSDNPPTLLVCLNRGTSVYNVFSKSETLAINTLDQGFDALSNLFGGKAAMQERFASAQWETLTTGSPVLVGAAVTFDCVITERLSVATHDVFFCRVVDIKQQEKAGALLYHQRQYRQLDAI